MLSFDPDSPFPLLPPDSHSYSEAKRHSAQVDDWLGLATEATERRLAERIRSSSPHQLWIGLPVSAMLTPYTELREILNRLSPQPAQTVVDLGAGYGRLGFVLGRQFAGTRFVGYELAPERVIEGNRCLTKAGLNAGLIEADLSAPDFAPAPAEFYFIYDYGTRAAIDKTLRDLQAIARAKPITVVGRGRASRDAIERGHPWLSEIVPPEHTAHYSIYRSASA